MRLVLGYPVEQRHLQTICQTAADWDVIDAGQDRLAEEILAADVFCGHAKVPLDWEAVVQQGRLRWIQSSAAGLDHCLHPAVVHSDIIVTSASGVLADQVAEHTIALIGAMLRNLPRFIEAQKAREFIRRPTRDLHGATVGIIGLGGVGRRLAELLAPYRVRILATDAFPRDKPAHVDALWPADQYPQLLRQSDIVVLCVPLTEVTRGMIDAEAIALMQDHALLLNVARGPVVVEKDLVAALRAGTIAGAALDVTEQEPPAASSELWELSNLLITPHVAGQSGTRIDKMTAFFCENLLRYRQGQPLLNRVDKKLGFPQPSPGPLPHAFL